MSTEFQFYWLKRVLAMGGDDIISNTTKLYTSFFFFLTMPHGLWAPSSMTRTRTQALGSKSMESQQLDHQRISKFVTS